jgi:hypothetical protein
MFNWAGRGEAIGTHSLSVCLLLPRGFLLGRGGWGWVSDNDKQAGGRAAGAGQGCPTRMAWAMNGEFWSSFRKSPWAV